jgi:hypothetical protein
VSTVPAGTVPLAGAGSGETVTLGAVDAADAPAGRDVVGRGVAALVTRDVGVGALAGWDPGRPAWLASLASRARAWFTAAVVSCWPVVSAMP